MDNQQKPTPPSKDPVPPARPPRRKLIVGVLAVVVIGGLLWGHPWSRTPAGKPAAGGAASGPAAGGGHRGRRG
ncbi:multidrug transporter subunit MdtA, partial [Burkholderia pseudomultivorans]|nr:multidrug transporter subunit MdtA [Burkholderia pseudomultivorans]